MNRRTFPALGATLLTLGLLSACGEDADSLGGASGDAGSPLVLMSIGSFETPVFSTPQIETGLRAALAEINGNGGINGRHVELQICNDKFDPNEATACAQRAVSEGVIAVIGGASAFSPQFMPVLEAAHIPLVAGSASSGAPELVEDISYPINAGAPGMSIGNGALAAQAGDNLVVVASDNEGSQAGAALTTLGAEANGATMRTVTMKLGAPDVSATVASAIKDEPDAVALQVVTEDALKVVTGLRQAGYEGVITGVGSLFPPASLEALGDKAEGIRVASRTVPITSTDIPEVQLFLDQMAAEDPEASTDDLALNAWTGMRLLAEVLDGQDVTDGASVIAAFAAIDEPIELGTAPAYTAPGSEPEAADYPRAPAFETVASVVKNGELVQDGDFFNPLN